MGTQTQLLPNAAFATEKSTTAVPIALSGSTSISLQYNSTTSEMLLTFAAAHGYTSTLNPNGTTTIQNTTTGHGPSQFGYTYFTLTGVTGVTALNTQIFMILSVPSASTMIALCTLTGTPVSTSATFIPVWCTANALYSFVLGANCKIVYNPDNTGSPLIPTDLSGQVQLSTPTVAPTFRQLFAVSASGQVTGDGAGQITIQATGSAATSYWSTLPR